MRLVNKEFERKVSAHLFRVVVVPFKPEIYGIAPDSPLGAGVDDASNDTLTGAIMLQDKGMRVFSGYVVSSPMPQVHLQSAMSKRTAAIYSVYMQLMVEKWLCIKLYL